MKTFFGLSLIVVGLLVGLYVGFWVLFIGGIVQVVEATQTDPISSMDIAIGVAKFCCSSIVGFICGLIFIIPGKCLLWSDTIGN